MRARRSSRTTRPQRFCPGRLARSPNFQPGFRPKPATEQPAAESGNTAPRVCAPPPYGPRLSESRSAVLNSVSAKNWVRNVGSGRAGRGRGFAGDLSANRPTGGLATPRNDIAYPEIWRQFARGAYKFAASRFPTSPSDFGRKLGREVAGRHERGFGQKHGPKCGGPNWRTGVEVPWGDLLGNRPISGGAAGLRFRPRKFRESGNSGFWIPATVCTRNKQLFVAVGCLLQDFGQRRGSTLARLASPGGWVAGAEASSPTANSPTACSEETRGGLDAEYGSADGSGQQATPYETAFGFVYLCFRFRGDRAISAQRAKARETAFRASDKRASNPPRTKGAERRGAGCVLPWSFGLFPQKRN